MHPTGGSRRVFREFAWLGAGSGKAALPPPAHPRVTQAVGRFVSSKLISEVIVEYQKDEQKDHEEKNIEALPLSSSISENLNRKYPYLTAYIGFTLLYLLSGVVAALTFTIPQSAFGRGFSPFTESFICIFQFVLGFYAFRYIVNKHILPYRHKP